MQKGASSHYYTVKSNGKKNTEQNSKLPMRSYERRKVDFLKGQNGKMSLHAYSSLPNCRRPFIKRRRVHNPENQ